MSDKPTFFLVSNTDPEWNAMWDQLAGQPINAGLTEPKVAMHETGECWQYLGTDFPGLIHRFRHRMHPRTEEQVRVAVPATTGYSAPA